MKIFIKTLLEVLIVTSGLILLVYGTLCFSTWSIIDPNWTMIRFSFAALYIIFLIVAFGVDNDTKT